MPGFGSFCPSLRISFAKTAFTRGNAHQLIAAPPRQEWFNHCRGGAAPFLMVVFTRTPPAREAVDSRTEQAPPSVGTGLFQKSGRTKETTPASGAEVHWGRSMPGLADPNAAPACAETKI